MNRRQREADRVVLETVMGLGEMGGPQRFLLPSGALFAEAYEGVVYGDRGPYIEFTRAQIVAPLMSRFGNDLSTLPPADGELFYLWLQPVTDPEVKVYWQAKTVSYADYRRGLCYVSPHVLTAPECKPRRPTLF